MRILFYISVILSGAITVGAVVMTQKYTAHFNPNGMKNNIGLPFDHIS